MKNKKNVPDVRFKGFSEEWAGKEFSNTFSPINNNTLSRAELNYDKGSVKNIHYGDVLIKFGECLDVSKEELPYVTNEKNVDKVSRLQDGDIVIADAAEDETVGKCTELLNVLNEGVVAGLHTIVCRPILAFAHGYLGYFLNAPIFHNQLIPLMQGTKVFSISKSAIKNTFIYYPNVPEQKQIGNYFQNIDRLINTSQTKLDKLKNIKKACLEKMFPHNGSTIPELRFKGFTEEWKEIRLGETNTYYTDGNYGTAYPKPSDITDSGNGVPFLRGSNICNGRLSERNANYITHSKHLELSSGHLQEDDIVITVRGSLGALGYVDQGCVNWNINSQLAIIRTDKNELIGSFLIQHLLSDKGQGIIISKISGSALKQLPIGQLKDVRTPITEVDEQITIGNFFTNLDDLIAKTEQQNNKLKNIKKACLDKMFVNTEGVI